jgi:hypothetical protein
MKRRERAQPPTATKHGQSFTFTKYHVSGARRLHQTNTEEHNVRTVKMVANDMKWITHSYGRCSTTISSVFKRECRRLAKGNKDKKKQDMPALRFGTRGQKMKNRSMHWNQKPS